MALHAIEPGASSGAATFLPEISKQKDAPILRTNSKGSVRTSNTMATDLSHFKKASPEALALMMKNLKNNNKVNGGGKAWMAGGGQKVKDSAKDPIQAKKLFY
jgi:hypothetical protein